MMTRDGAKNRGQTEFTSLDELVPEDHLVRKLENAIDWSFIYEMVMDSYCENNRRPSLDPVILIKLPVIQYENRYTYELKDLYKYRNETIFFSNYDANPLSA